MAKRRFEAHKLVIKAAGQRPARWKWQKRNIRGTEYDYRVLDYNFSRYRRWLIRISEPDAFDHGAYVKVQPINVPARKLFAGLERRSINLPLGTVGDYKHYLYAKVSISDIGGRKNRLYVKSSDRQGLPQWLRSFKLRKKETVAFTDAFDGDALVAVIRPGDHRAMIRLFLASKAWVLSSGFRLSD